MVSVKPGRLDCVLMDDVLDSICVCRVCSQRGEEKKVFEFGFTLKSYASRNPILHKFALELFQIQSVETHR